MGQTSKCHAREDAAGGPSLNVRHSIGGSSGHGVRPSPVCGQTRGNREFYNCPMEEVDPITWWHELSADQVTIMWLILIGSCGMKVFEVARLRAEYITYNANGWARARLPPRQGDQWHTVMIGPRAFIELARFLPESGQGLVFTRSDGSGYDQTYISHRLNAILRKHGSLQTATAIRHMYPNG